MADYVDEYEDKVHNTFAKIVMIDLVDVMNQVATSTSPTDEEKKLTELAKRADLNGLAIRGSALYNFVNADIPYARNPGDIDMQVVGGKHYNCGKAMEFSRLLIDYAAKQIGGSARHPDVEGVHRMTPSGRIAFLLGMKARTIVDVTLRPDQLQHVLDHAEHYRLRGQDRELIEHAIEDGETPTLSLKVDIKGVMRKPDLPPMDFNGQEVVLEKGKFQGIMVQHYLEQAVEKIHAMCNPRRDNPLDQVDLHNFVRLLGRPDGRLTPEDIATAKKHMFNLGSTWTVHHRGYSFAYERYADAVHGLPRYTKEAPNAEEFAVAKSRIERLRDNNLLSDMPDDAMLHDMFDAAHENAIALLGQSKSVAEKVKHRPKGNTEIG